MSEYYCQHPKGQGNFHCKKGLSFLEFFILEIITGDVVVGGGGEELLTRTPWLMVSAHRNHDIVSNLLKTSFLNLCLVDSLCHF